MSTTTWSLRRLHAVDVALVDQLANLLIDCVEGGASVSFEHPEICRAPPVRCSARSGPGKPMRCIRSSETQPRTTFINPTFR